ncbi:MAG: right-handed parallel beta-helix repeat-containing protein [Dokdonella sp.]|uniref:right-handed parallel beta-helix repeat-containing protein n=1 Tax=Dokdonella sp. TaxID=2291710 RepID=UPI003F7CFDAA
MLGGLLAHGAAHAGAILVGRGPSCTEPTLQTAIERAYRLPGFSLIILTDDVPDGVYRENVDLAGVPSGVSLEIVGGFDNCRDLTPTAFGRASIYGGNDYSIEQHDRGELSLRNLWIEGSWGLGWNDANGGELRLQNVTINHIDGSGIRFFGSGSILRLQDTVVSNSRGIELRGGRTEFLGNVKVIDNQDVGVRVGRGASFAIYGEHNEISGNGGDGIQASEGMDAIEIGATGPVLSQNVGLGLHVKVGGGNPTGNAVLYSTDPGNPLTISDNAFGAIRVGTPASYRLCARNVVLDGNLGRAIHADGPSVFVEMNGPMCDFPDAANVRCPALDAAHGCNRIVGNGRPNVPLVSAFTGARVDVHRTLFAYNNASSILSTNLGVATSSASLTLTDSVVTKNTLRDNLFESLNGGIVDIWDTTVFENTGTFQTSFIGIDAGLLQMTNAILDQPQVFVNIVGGAASAHFTNVIAPNRIGAAPGDVVILERPLYFDSLGRLDPDSPGVDYGQAGGGVDFAGAPRDVDTADVLNVNGPRDLGAFELQLVEVGRIFADSFGFARSR